MAQEDAKGDGEGLTPPLNAVIIQKLLRADVREKKLARKVVWFQLLVTSVATAGTALGWESSPQYAIAVLGGGGVSVFSNALLAWRMTRATMHSAFNAYQQLRLMYFCAAERFMAVVALLGICLAVLKLTPVAVLAGFVLAQTAHMGGRLLFKFKIEDSD